MFRRVDMGIHSAATTKRQDRNTSRLAPRPDPEGGSEMSVSHPERGEIIDLETVTKAILMHLEIADVVHYAFTVS